MKIGINGRFLLAKRTGVQRAAYNLITKIIAMDPDNEYLIFTGMDHQENPEFDKPNVKIIGSKLKSSESFQNHLWEQITLPKLAKKHGVDILHSPANMAPLFYSGKSIVHIHDLCFVVNPQWYSFLFRTFYNIAIPRIARAASRVITNSNNSKNDLFKFCHVEASKVNLIYWAVDEMFIKNQFENEKEDYILYVGSLEPRKNITSLIEAYEILREKNPSIKSKLFLVGGESPLFGEVRLKAKKYIDDVLLKGFVNDQQLIEYYRKAKMLVYPSLYEGFGLPPLEAMASGTPVVTSYSSSIPEVVEDAAILIDPKDTNALSNAMHRVLTNDDLSQSLIKKGYEQSKVFNWDKVARATLRVYQEVYNEHESYLDFKEWSMLNNKNPNIGSSV